MSIEVKKFIDYSLLNTTFSDAYSLKDNKKLCSLFSFIQYVTFQHEVPVSDGHLHDPSQMGLQFSLLLTSIVFSSSFSCALNISGSEFALLLGTIVSCLTSVTTRLLISFWYFIEDVLIYLVRYFWVPNVWFDYLGYGSVC